MKTKLLSAILFVLCTVVLFGCANIEYQRFINPDGSIQDTIVFEIDESVDDVTCNQILTDIETDARKYYETPINEQKLKLLDKQIRDGIQISVTRSNDFRTVKVNTYCATTELFMYLNTDILPEVYELNIENAEESQKDDITYSVSAFIIKYIEKSANAFGDVTQFELQLKNTSTSKNFCDYYANEYCNGTFDANDIKLTQLYVSPDTRLNSNANYTQIQNGMKYHLWELDASDPDFELEFYYRIPNSTGWYYLALGITIALMFALLIIYSKRSERKRTENNDEIEIKDFDEHNRDF